ncbi:hybrid sensor histidine kinase/response regulator [Candidatus Parabeggiatoa sp. HSG14]|uniref:hybrid sensor histidine kinase/response regulator n=1 Tax=Candidatus Parabeggiatoa sp. HSG14 TaxID=3055593 RepID=UPI0025A9161B|nr:hybrid sensor histidine kinase/response regulator [Thiotrichales bacterium HSG14]
MNKKQNQLILVVDDNTQNLQMLGDLLKKSGYRSALAEAGDEALDFVKTRLPDLILLDIMMPKMDGLEVCRQLKQNPSTKDIPIIFLSAKSRKEDIIKGLEMGAVDYITKPFHIKELLTRVNVHLDLKVAKEVIISQKKKLDQNIEELKQANATKDKFFSIIAHDLINPLNSLMGLSEILVINKDEEEKEKLLPIILQSSKRCYSLIKNLLEWSRLQTGRIKIYPEKLILKYVIEKNVELLGSHAKTKSINIFLDVPETMFLFVDVNMLDTVIRNLLSNAIKFTPVNGKIEIFSKEENNCIEISILDSGIGIKPEDIDKLFRVDISHTTIGTSEEKGTGLGLILCKEFVEKNGGTIAVESEVEKGSRFYIRFPSQK